MWKLCGGCVEAMRRLCGGRVAMYTRTAPFKGGKRDNNFTITMAVVPS